MPQSKNAAKVVHWQDARNLRKKSVQMVDSHYPDPEELSKYLTPVEVERAREEGWSRIIEKMRNKKDQ
jgi:hypothetical protein